MCIALKFVWGGAANAYRNILNGSPNLSCFLSIAPTFVDSYLLFFFSTSDFNLMPLAYLPGILLVIGETGAIVGMECKP